MCCPYACDQDPLVPSRVHKSCREIYMASVTETAPMRQSSFQPIGLSLHCFLTVEACGRVTRATKLRKLNNFWLQAAYDSHQLAFAIAIKHMRLKSDGTCFLIA